MTLEQLNDLINRGYIGAALLIIVFVVVFTIFRRDVEKIMKSRSH